MLCARFRLRTAPFCLSKSFFSKTSTKLDVFQVNGTQPPRADRAFTTSVVNRFLTGHQESNPLREVLPDRRRNFRCF